MLSAVTFYMLAAIFHLGGVVGKWQKDSLYTQEGTEKWYILYYMYLSIYSQTIVL